MKLHRSKDERWPDYSLHEPTNYWKANVEVSEELYERYKKALAEYNAVQREIANLKRIDND